MAAGPKAGTGLPPFCGRLLVKFHRRLHDMSTLCLLCHHLKLGEFFLVGCQQLFQAILSVEQTFHIQHRVPTAGVQQQALTGGQPGLSQLQPLPQLLQAPVLLQALSTQGPGYLKLLHVSFQLLHTLCHLQEGWFDSLGRAPIWGARASRRAKPSVFAFPPSSTSLGLLGLSSEARPMLCAHTSRDMKWPLSSSRCPSCRAFWA